MERIIVLNRTRAIKYSYQPQEKTFGIISISELADSVPNFHSSSQLKGLLKLQFDDVDQNKDGYYAMTEQDAQKIATFVKQCSSHFDILVVHCLAGRSRSAGVAAAIAKWKFGDDSEFFRNYTPNMHCYRLVLEKLMEGN